MKPFSRSAVAIYLAITFLLGGVAGWAVGFQYGKTQVFRPPPPSGTMSQRILQRLTSELTLTEDQQRQIEPLIKEGAAEMEKLHRETTQRIREAIKAGHQKLLPLLTEAQRKKLAELDAEREKNGWGREGRSRAPESGPDRGPVSTNRSPLLISS